MRNLIKTSLDTIEKPTLMKMIAKIAKDETTRLAMEKEFGQRKLFDPKRLTGSGLITHMTKIEHIIKTPILYFSDEDTETGLVFSLKNSKNIINQAGVFVWNADSAKPTEIIGEEQFREAKKIDEYEQTGYRFCNCFNNHKTLEKHIRKRLETDGITREYIYPTKDLSTWSVFEKSKSREK